MSLIPKLKINIELKSCSLQCYLHYYKTCEWNKGMFCWPSCGINQIFFVHQDKFYVEIKKKTIGILYRVHHIWKCISFHATVLNRFSMLVLFRLYFQESYSFKITLHLILFFLGLFPDVGGGYALSRMKGKLGIFLALTGEGKFCCCDNITMTLFTLSQHC